jgi:two-component system cell cycle sensor histidine kinase PleC
LTDIEPQAFFDKSPYMRFLLKKKGNAYVFVKFNEAFSKYSDVKNPKVLTDLVWLDDEPDLTESLDQCFAGEKDIDVVEIKRTSVGDVRFYNFALARLEQANCENLVEITIYPNPRNYSALKQERDDAQILFNSIFQTIGVGMIVMDHHRRIVRINDSFLAHYHWEAQELIGEDFTTIFCKDLVDEAILVHQRVIEGINSGALEMRLSREKDGEMLCSDVLVTSAMLEMTQKRRFQMMAFIDISDRKAMEEHLVKAKDDADTANKAKSDFLANMSHELRTPLNAIIGFSDMMMNELFGPLGNERYKEYLEDVFVSAKHLLAIINDVLDMAKIEAGRFELDERVIDPTSLIHTIRRMMDSKLVSSKLTMVIDVVDNMPRLKGDERLIRQILMNLISNSLKFTPAGKNIFLKAAYLNDEIIITVEDEGIGIPLDQHQAVLEPFGQVSDPRHNRGQGTGLGLPLARVMMELHGGSLSLQSEEGKGTKVICRFPVDRVIKAGQDMTF